MKIKFFLLLMAATLLVGINAYCMPGDSAITRLGLSVDSLEDTIKALAAKVSSAIQKDTGDINVSLTSLVGSVDRWKKNSSTKYKTTFGDFNTVLSIVLLIMAIVFTLIICKSALCRDASFEMEADGKKKLKDIKDRPFSYSRTQCAWWTFIIFSCYSAACIYFKELLPLNQTMLILLGGGLAIRVFGKVIDNSQIQKNPGSANRQQDVYPTQGFWEDITSDEDGVSVSRLQTVLFNILFGIGFFASCFGNVSNKLYPFPEFDLWQFALLGISASGYLGMKAGDNSTATESVRNSALKK